MAEKQEKLLNKFNQTDSSTITNKESSKNGQEEAAEVRRNVSQFDNQTKLGAFAVEWIINAVSILSIILVVMIFVYVYKISFDQDKLELLLKTVYTEISSFIYKYQAALAAIAVFIFGDTIKGKTSKK